MKIRGLAALALAVVLGACTSHVTLPDGASTELVDDQTIPVPEDDSTSRTGGAMGSGA